MQLAQLESAFFTTSMLNNSIVRLLKCIYAKLGAVTHS